MPETELQSPPGRISFQFPEDMPGIKTVIRLDGTNPPACYLNENFTIKLIRQTQSVLHFRRKSLYVSGGIGVVGLLDPGEMLRTSPRGIPDTIHGIMIDPDFMAQRAGELGLPLRSLWFQRAIVSHPALFGKMAHLLDSLQRGDTTLERQSRLASVVETVLQTTMEARPKDKKLHKAHAAVQRAREIIHERFANQITLEELTAETGLSRCHLIRTFTEEVGVPPHRYQIHLRIARARELLARGLSPSFVGTTVGFYDQAHFSNHFRQIVGVTPGRFGQREKRARYGGRNSTSWGRTSERKPPAYDTGILEFPPVFAPTHRGHYR